MNLYGCHLSRDTCLMSPVEGRGGEKGQVSEALQWGLRNLGYWEGSAYLGTVEEKSKLRRREERGLWHMEHRCSLLGFLIFQLTQYPPIAKK